MTSPAPEQQAVYQAQPGPQALLLCCPINDILYGGARGGGKTYAMIGDWLSHAGRYGKDARGLWLRRSMPELRDVLRKMLPLFAQLGATYKAVEHEFTFPNGSTLTLAYLESDADATRYQGWEQTWLGVDDAGTWPDPGPIDLIQGSMRSPKGVPIRLVMTCNPGGEGHEWLKSRYVHPGPAYVPHTDADGNVRVYIPAKLEDNQILMKADPNYVQQIKKACAGRPWLYEAWRNGDWDAEAAGGMVEPPWLDHTWDVLPERRGARLVISVDPAEDIAKKNDDTGIVIGLHKEYYTYLLYVERVKLLLEPLKDKLEALAKAFSPDLVLVEKKSVGGAIVQNLKCRPGWKWSALARDPGQLSKAERLWEQVPNLMGGRVLLPSAKAMGSLPLRSDWYAFRKEVIAFTGDPRKKEKDNQVDALSQILREFFGTTSGEATWQAIADKRNAAAANRTLAQDPRYAYALRAGLPVPGR